MILGKLIPVKLTLSQYFKITVEIISLCVKYHLFSRRQLPLIDKIGVVKIV